MTIKMKKLILFFLTLFPLMISACANQQPPAQSLPTATADPCLPENLPVTVQKINDLMREFDDASLLASNLPAQQLAEVISNMQRIRRSAEDLQIPGCLTTLKSYQLNHMNIMIQTLLAFVGGRANQETLTSGLANARQEHDRYSLELVRLLGITPVSITSTPPLVNETAMPPASTTP
jgi:hypothetical protein